MASKIEYGGRLLAFGLLTFLLYEVTISVHRLREEKTAVSTTKQYDWSRFMPTIAVCFDYDKSQDYQGRNVKELAKITLNQSRQVKIIVDLLSFQLSFHRLQVLDSLSHKLKPIKSG